MLKRLSLYGFKTFAKKTDIEFNNGITCIVGPNGSGKSNISDALRWVLGEQGTKSLRSDKLTEVIFVGSEFSKPLNYAEVTLLLENKSEFFPLKYSEIEIIRRVYRDNKSEFFINRTPCRLKDIQELFMDTGLGKGGISIIGQGQVDKIIASEPGEIKSLFEETAGINKYQHRKQVAIKKLEGTQNNLLRLSDILLEVEGRLAPLKKEVNRLSRVKRYEERTGQLEKQLLYQEYFELEHKEEEISRQLDLYNNEVFSVKTQLEELENKHKDYNNKLKELRKEFSIKEEDIGKIKLELEQVRGRYQSYKTRQKELNDRFSTLSELLNSLEDQKSFMSQDISADEEKLEELKIKSFELERNINNTEKEYKKELSQTEYVKEEYTKCKEKLLKTAQKIVINSKELDHLIESYDELKKEMFNLQDSIEENKKILSEYSRSKEELLKKLDESSRNKDVVKSEIRLIKEQRDITLMSLENIKKEMASLAREFSKKEIRYNFLCDMEKEYEGYYPGVKAIMTAREKIKDLSGVIGVVGSLIKVPEEYEKAIEVALGGHIQDIVTETDRDARLSVEYLRENKKGRATFLPLNIIKTSDMSREEPWHRTKCFIGQASRLVDYNPLYNKIVSYLLGHYYIVTDLKNGIELLKNYNVSGTLVTLEGDIIRPSGAITGGSNENKKIGLLSRTREIEALSLEILNVKKGKDELINKEKRFKKELENIERSLKIKIDKLSSIESNNMDLLRKKDILLLEEKQINKTLEKLKKDLENSSERTKNVDLNIGKLQEEIHKLREMDGSLELQRKELEGKLSGKENEGNKILDLLTDLKIEYATCTETINNINNFISSRKMQYGQIESNHRSCYDEIETLKNILYDMENKEKEDKSRLSSLETLYGNSMASFEMIKAQKKSREDDIEDIGERTVSKRDELSERERVCNEILLSRTKISTEKDLMKVKLPEGFNITEFMEPEKITEELEMLRNRIETMGFINYQAEEEYKEVDERYRFLLEQKADLEESIFSLNRLIEDVDKKSRDKFKITFNAVSEEFTKMYSHLFSGGKAFLTLTDEEDLLKSGIEISVNPPGKKLQSISLLSGGEKTMAALILLLSIFKIKPTPFCIFDEVDAALDDGNTITLAKCLKDFASLSQFIVITHNKLTMEHGNVLYGITMEDPGISSIISLKLGDPVLSEITA